MGTARSLGAVGRSVCRMAPWSDVQLRVVGQDSRLSPARGSGVVVDVSVVEGGANRRPRNRAGRHIGDALESRIAREVEVVGAKFQAGVAPVLPNISLNADAHLSRLRRVASAGQFCR